VVVAPDDVPADHAGWSDEAAKAKNYYLNSFGRNQVSMPWRVEESFSYFKRFEPGDYTFK